jgi:hypothetical protein
MVRVGAPRPGQQGSMCTQHPRRLGARSSHRVWMSRGPLWVKALFFLDRVGALRSLRIAFGGRVVRVGTPCGLRIAYGGRIVRVVAPRPSFRSQKSLPTAFDEDDDSDNDNDNDNDD